MSKVHQQHLATIGKLCTSAGKGMTRSEADTYDNGSIQVADRLDIAVRIDPRVASGDELMHE